MLYVENSPYPTFLFISLFRIFEYHCNKDGFSAFKDIRLNITGEATYESLGISVKMSADGTTIVVGAQGPDKNGNDNGHVRVYNFNASINKYAQVGSDIYGPFAKSDFGRRVGVSANGTTIVIGAPGSGTNSTSESPGVVRVYSFNSATNSYEQIGMDIIGKKAGDKFGEEVDISADGTKIVVGAPIHKGTGLASGQVRIYHFNYTTSSYDQIGVDIIGEAAQDRFGSSVCISADGTTIVLGAARNDGIGSNSGHARVYQFNNTVSLYTQVGSDIEGEMEGAGFGTAVSISADGKTFVATGIFNSENGEDSGHARVYNYNATIHEYTQIGSDINGEGAFDKFGLSVSMFADGSGFVASAEGTSAAGIVRVYSFNSSINSYTQVGASIYGTTADDYFGNSVSVSGDGSKFVVGAPGHNGNFGRAYVFEYSNTTEAPTTTPTTMPTKAPTIAPVIASTSMPTKAPTATGPITNAPAKIPTPNSSQSPTKVPVLVAPPTTIQVNPPTKCGVFGLQIFCPRSGKCGFFRRLFSISGC